MTESIAKYLLENVALLFAEKRYSSFTHLEAISILGKSGNYTGAILGKLVRSGWLEKKTPDPYDKRKKLYRVRPLEETLFEIGRSEE
ncbi:MAG TPA: MarR family transcriptional regulator [Methanoregulaceae archaeon]|nr:MarR family transcriptional regulator [Methanoregulaceae archaeon]